MAAEYEIVTVADFQKVPSDRLCACLGEFVTCLIESRKLHQFGLGLDSFTWIDDGVPEIREVELEWPDGSKDHYPNPNFPQA